MLYLISHKNLFYILNFYFYGFNFLVRKKFILDLIFTKTKFFQSELQKNRHLEPTYLLNLVIYK